MKPASRTDLNSVLVIGFGNPGRLDDGLGPAIAARLAEAGLEGVTVDSDYQLNIENAAEIAEHDVVLFIDASVSAPDPFLFRKLVAKGDATFSTHSVSPEAVLHLAHACFGSKAAGYILEIRGHVFDDFGEELSEQAAGNLEAATGFALDLLKNRSFEEAAACGCASSEAQ